MKTLRVGLMVDSPHKRQYLVLSVREAGHQPLPQLTGPVDPVDADAWIVDMAFSPEQDMPAEVQALLEQSRIPVIVSDSSDYRPGGEPHRAWLKRTLIKLKQLAGDINLHRAPCAPRLWVLAASTGGPAAVQRFIEALPPALGVAFLYVQHIDHSYADTLVRMMSRSGYSAVSVAQGAVLAANRLLIVSGEPRVELMENGTLALSSKPWQTPYVPSVDCLVAQAARLYGDRLGLVIFTGMGDDGASAARLVKRYGGRVWAQSPEDCISASMPEAVIATGAVTVIDTPEGLARQLSVEVAGSDPSSADQSIEERQSYERPAAY